MDMGLVGKVYITGLGLPSEMLAAVEAGACDSFAIWNPVEYGYSATMIMADILGGADVAEGATLSMGKKGDTKVGPGGEAVMGEPFVFNKENVAEFAEDLLTGGGGRVFQRSGPSAVALSHSSNRIRPMMRLPPDWFAAPARGARPQGRRREQSYDPVNFRMCSTAISNG